VLRYPFVIKPDIRLF